MFEADDRAPHAEMQHVMSLVAADQKIPLKLLRNQARCRMATARARHLAMYLSHVVCGHTMIDVGQAFGRNRKTVSYACARIEDLREDLAFDARVCALEAALAQTSCEVGHG